MVVVNVELFLLILLPFLDLIHLLLTEAGVNDDGPGVWSFPCE